MSPQTAILVAALLLRLLIVWFVMARFPHGWFFTRGLELGTLAQHLASGKGLSSPFGVSTGPTALLAPAYPVLAALVFRCLGAFTPAAAATLMTFQAACNAATVLIMMRLARAHFGARAASLSGVFWAISLPLLWMPTIFWETCLSTLLLTGMLALALHCAHTPALGPWIGAGVYAGFACLVNPALLFSLLALLGWAGWTATRPEAGLRICLAGIAFVLVFSPWPLRNLLRLHAFIPLRSTVGLELWMGNREGATGFLDESVFPLFNREELQQYMVRGEAAYMNNKAALAWAYIHAHPRVSLERTLIRFARFWTGAGTQHGSWIYPVQAVFTSALGGWGLWRLLRQHRFRLAALFLLPLLLFPLPYYLTHAEFRYRLVIDPLLTILAGYALSPSPLGPA